MVKEITSLQNPLVKHLTKLRQNHDYRLEHDHMIVEGAKIVREISQQHSLKTLLITQENLIPEGVSVQEVFVVSLEIIEKISGLRSSDGILAEIEIPKFSSLEGIKKLLVLDEINDPGNLGTLLRTALALGWEGVYIVNGSCDPYNEKAIRAARGATFHLPLRIGSWKELEEIFLRENHFSIVADITGDFIEKYQGKKAIALILSNEARGPSENALRLSERVSIPMPGEMESLNVAVAGGILLYALRGQ